MLITKILLFFSRTVSGNRSLLVITEWIGLSDWEKSEGAWFALIYFLVSLLI